MDTRSAGGGIWTPANVRLGSRPRCPRCDVETSRVLEVTLSRSYEATRELWLGLSQAQRDSIEAVAMDMWDAYLTATHICVPQARIVYDKFHVSQELNQAIDLIRRKEHQPLLKKGDRRLSRPRQCWLLLPEKLSPERKEQFHQFC